MKMNAYKATSVSCPLTDKQQLFITIRMIFIYTMITLLLGHECSPLVSYHFRTLTKENGYDFDNLFVTLSKHILNDRLVFYEMHTSDTSDRKEHPPNIRYKIYMGTSKQIPNAVYISSFSAYQSLTDTKILALNDFKWLDAQCIIQCNPTHSSDLIADTTSYIYYTEPIICRLRIPRIYKFAYNQAIRCQTTMRDYIVYMLNASACYAKPCHELMLCIHIIFSRSCRMMSYGQPTNSTPDYRHLQSIYWKLKGTVHPSKPDVPVCRRYTASPRTHYRIVLLHQWRRPIVGSQTNSDDADVSTSSGPDLLADWTEYCDNNNDASYGELSQESSPTPSGNYYYYTDVPCYLAPLQCLDSTILFALLIITDQGKVDLHNLYRPCIHTIEQMRLFKYKPIDTVMYLYDQIFVCKILISADVWIFNTVRFRAIDSMSQTIVWDYDKTGICQNRCILYRLVYMLNLLWCSFYLLTTTSLVYDGYYTRVGDAVKSASVLEKTMCHSHHDANQYIQFYYLCRMMYLSAGDVFTNTDSNHVTNTSPPYDVSNGKVYPAVCTIFHPWCIHVAGTQDQYDDSVNIKSIPVHITILTINNVYQSMENYVCLLIMIFASIFFIWLIVRWDIRCCHHGATRQRRARVDGAHIYRPHSGFWGTSTMQLSSTNETKGTSNAKKDIYVCAGYYWPCGYEAIWTTQITPSRRDLLFVLICYIDLACLDLTIKNPGC